MSYLTLQSDIFGSYDYVTKEYVDEQIGAANDIEVDL